MYNLYGKGLYVKFKNTVFATALIGKKQFYSWRITVLCGILYLYVNLQRLILHAYSTVSLRNTWLICKV